MTLSSMTGFARVEGHHADTGWVLEARSVNGRSLDIKVRTPPGLDAIERAAKDLGKARFQRGQISLTLTVQRPETRVDFTVNQAVLDRYLEIGQTLMSQGMATMPSFDGLLTLRGVIEAQGPEAADTENVIEAPILADLGAVLEQLKESRLSEGRVLHALLKGQLAAMTTALDRAEALALSQTETIRERFARRLNEMLPNDMLGSHDLEDRILQEAAVLATKADVREETDRLRTHIASAHALIDDTASQGRKLDFLSQEFMREANTLCAKAAVTELTQVGLELKSVIDQFREQIQNVE